MDGNQLTEQIIRAKTLTIHGFRMATHRYNFDGLNPLRHLEKCQSTSRFTEGQINLTLSRKRRKAHRQKQR